MDKDDPKLIDYWNKAWQSDNPDFSSAEKHAWLIKDPKNLDYLLRGRQNQKIFFPLCGNAVDMKWMGDLGHHIVGVDLGKRALTHFMESHKIPYTEEASEKCDGTLYKSNDDKYRLYGCDFFKFNKDIESNFDAIFDSAGLVAIHKDLRQQYADLMISLMNPDTVHIVEGVHFAERPWEGPPYGLVESEVREIYEPRCDVTVLENFIFKMSGGEGENAYEEEMDCTVFKVTLKK